MPAASPDNLNDWSSQLQTLRALAQVVHDEKLSELEVESDGLLITLKSPAAVAHTALSTTAHAPTFEYSTEDFTAETLARQLRPAQRHQLLQALKWCRRWWGCFIARPAPATRTLSR
jgi:hypothetical protein